MQYEVKATKKQKLEQRLGKKLKLTPEELIRLSEVGDIRMILRELLLYVYK